MVVLHTSQGLEAHGGGVFVPTMGALHGGHAALVRLAAGMKRAGHGGPVVVSIFVNPTQFNDPKDLERYPRTLDTDVQLCRGAGADIVFAPAVAEVYPLALARETPALPEAATEPGLEDAQRPGHFAGVCQVVRRLFDLVRPRSAVFGEKDYQQLAVVRAMTREAKLPIAIVPGETVREPDGLAMSSRNRFLAPAERERAGVISRALCEGAGVKTVAEAEGLMSRLLTEAGLAVDYAVVRDAETLGPVQAGRPGRALIAARLGSVRLIDNAAWG